MPKLKSKHFTSDYFKPLRAYTDNELPEIVNLLLKDKKLIKLLIKEKTSTWSNFKKAYLFWFFPIAPIIFKLKIKYKFYNINKIYEFQEKFIAPYMKRMIHNTIDNLSNSGLENLSKDYLFLSNHRDIVVDPALVNYVLHQHLNNTAYIAIGDNLLQEDFISHLMRMNKSFIVPRGYIGTLKEKYNKLSLLSEYIKSLRENNQSIWIAQREGRSKDGIDKTSDSVLKMISLAYNKNIETTLNETRIIPVSISYEYDPCDTLKAKELWHIKAYGKYEKKEYEDIDSIKKGIIGRKGNVHISFCNLIEPNYSDLNTLIVKIDQEIINSFYLMPTHISAYRYICKQDNLQNLQDILPYKYDENILDSKEKLLIERCDILENEEQKRIFFQIYANPVFSWLKLNKK